MVKLTKKRLVLLGAGGALALGIAAPAVAYAADTTPSPSASTSTSTPSNQGDRRGPDQGEFAKALAKELGLDEQKVTDALKKVRDQLKPQQGDRKPDAQSQADRLAKLKERLAQAVKDGKLTQAEADAIVKASEAGVLFQGGPGGHGPRR
jgi:hypothetical protein